jgi:hypothetical protein
MNARIAGAAVAALLSCGTIAAQDGPLAAGSEVRLTAGDAREIPGVLRIERSGVVTAGRLVAYDAKLVAVEMPGMTVPVALPRPGARPIGRLVAVDDDAITVRFDGQRQAFRVPRPLIAGLEVNRGGRPRVLRKMAAGAGVGALAGILIGVASGNDDPGFMSFTAEEKAMVAGVGLGILGAGIGTIVGLAQPRARWVRVELSAPRAGLLVRPRRPGGFSAALTVRF